MQGYRTYLSLDILLRQDNRPPQAQFQEAPQNGRLGRRRVHQGPRNQAAMTYKCGGPALSCGRLFQDPAGRMPPIDLTAASCPGMAKECAHKGFERIGTTQLTPCSAFNRT